VLLRPPTGESKIQKEANGSLSIGYGSGYTTMGPEYGFGIAMEEELDAPILIIKCSWGNTALGAAWRTPSAPPRTETPVEKARRQAYDAVLAEKAKAEGKEFTPTKPAYTASPSYAVSKPDRLF